jgi:hypothetical protein
MKEHAHDDKHLPYVFIQYSPRTTGTDAAMGTGSHCSAGSRRTLRCSWNLPVTRGDVAGLDAQLALELLTVSLLLRLQGTHPEPDRVYAPDGVRSAAGPGAPWGATGEVIYETLPLTWPGDAMGAPSSPGQPV